VLIEDSIPIYRGGLLQIREWLLDKKRNREYRKLSERLPRRVVMKRLFMLLPILLFILSIRTNAAVIRADASPLLLPGLIEVGQP